jgi:hypothetical protein
MCIKFAEMERRLGEIDRARAIYGHASQFCDPRVDAVFWKKWEAFEVQHGNEDTFKEMLRIKRSVQAQFKYVPLLLPTNSIVKSRLLTFSFQHRRQLHRLASHRSPTSRPGGYQRRCRRRARFRHRSRQNRRHGRSGKTSKSSSRFRRRIRRTRRRQQAHQRPGLGGRQRQRRQERRGDRSR